MKKEKHITRYGQERGSGYTFKGWRLCLTRGGERFVRYFSDLKYGSSEASLAAAVAMRDIMLNELATEDAQSEEIFRRYRRLGNEC
ncbi:MAG: hypothetical protein Q4F38_06895 [Akkermansia sp.]|nr:hypothetical protein [Akkermansia sp.]